MVLQWSERLLGKKFTYIVQLGVPINLQPAIAFLRVYQVKVHLSCNIAIMSTGRYKEDSSISRGGGSLYDIRQQLQGEEEWTQVVHLKGDVVCVCVCVCVSTHYLEVHLPTICCFSYKEK